MQEMAIINRLLQFTNYHGANQSSGTGQSAAPPFSRTFLKIFFFCFSLNVFFIFSPLKCFRFIRPYLFLNHFFQSTFRLHMNMTFINFFLTRQRRACFVILTFYINGHCFFIFPIWTEEILIHFFFFSLLN